MKKILLLILLCFSINANAMRWEKLYSDSKLDIYIFDKENKKKENNFYIKLMINYLEPIYSKSTILVNLKLDCKKSRIVVLKKSLYVEKIHDLFGSRNFNEGNLLSDKVHNELVKRIC